MNCMKGHRRLQRMLVVFAALAVIPAAAGAQTGTCQWVCSGDTCRADGSGDCTASSPVVQVASDPQAPACAAGDLQTATETAAPDSAGPVTSPAPPPAGPGPTQVLLTGFCPFGNIDDNPSQRILDSALQAAVMAQCGGNLSLTMVCLAVQPQAIQSCDISNRIVISLGVDDGSNGFRLETGAVNEFVDGGASAPVCLGPPTIVGSAPRPTLPGQIGTYPVANGPIDPQNNYVCNATYYWLCNQGTCSPYFLHVPNFAPTEDAGIVPGLAQLICNIIAANLPAPAPAPTPQTTTGM